MGILRRVLLFILIALALLWFFRAAAFRSLVHYRITGQRAPVKALALSRYEVAELDEAIANALDSTAALLHFSAQQVSSDPEVLQHGGPANCIGYAALCAALLKGRFNGAGLGERYKVEAVVGKLYFGDQDLHAFFASPFWKDHDVVRIVDRVNGAIALIDPTLYDAVGIGRVTSENVGISHAHE